MVLIAGCDEAGRGPCIGPLVLCIAWIEKKKEPLLSDLGVKDSKKIAPEKRAAVFQEMVKWGVGFDVVEISAGELNDLMKRMSLNEIEAMKAGIALSRAPEFEKVYMDSPDTEAAAFARRVKKYFSGKAELVAEHKADDTYPVCSAASIIAKVTRDKRVEEIKQELGVDFGSGYPSDERTVAFLKTHWHQPEVRKHLREKWETIERLKQRKLDDF